MSNDFFGIPKLTGSNSIGDHYRETGWIYVLSNPSLHGMLKIGMTTISPEARSRELSRSTSIPTPFIIEASFFSKNPALDEKDIHELLHEKRVNDRREFFHCSVEDAISVIQEELGLTSTTEAMDSLPINYHVASMDPALKIDAESILEELNISHFGEASSCLFALAKLGAELVRDKNRNHLQSLLIKGGELHCLECRNDA
ncbi:GIY-YIG nuclease family protein [Cronobacter sakazakii]|nr:MULTISPECIES: GIY-YIG nuclease family protein [Cronobacter]EJO9054108.1 GIY-YIG nuclease family protein [Cronobacter sakazakii]EJO9494191.1 GIY-YIG nuclease family protein [Cronobacter sakazakii]EJP5820346.1 GIY-YIG nuclease family protein [Cronobacter sakazakii]EJP5828921.1 GIY-YIG nuclease family protein [Cronobacter sakazakii]EJQ8906811.1 GIY-YIG nuclease family protein [Cronobacter sakazakii]